MKASVPMFLYYLGMIGVPVLLVLLAVSVLVPGSGVARFVLLVLAAAGSLGYGIVAIRECYVHGTAASGRRPAAGADEGRAAR
jgi:hypothetical protein